MYICIYENNPVTSTISRGRHSHGCQSCIKDLFGSSTIRCIPHRHLLQFFRRQSSIIDFINEGQPLFLIRFIIWEGRSWSHRFKEEAGGRDGYGNRCRFIRLAFHQMLASQRNLCACWRYNILVTVFCICAVLVLYPETIHHSQNYTITGNIESNYFSFLIISKIMVHACLITVRHQLAEGPSSIHCWSWLSAISTHMDFAILDHSLHSVTNIQSCRMITVVFCSIDLLRFQKFRHEKSFLNTTKHKNIFPEHISFR